jgi:hypothetical protein
LHDPRTTTSDRAVVPDPDDLGGNAFGLPHHAVAPAVQGGSRTVSHRPPVQS